MSSLINPYKLLGVTINSSLKELKKSYYNYSLICHPDRGGNSNDMIIVHNAYQYVKEQIEFSLNKENLENVEDDFKNYFKNNYRKPPNFYEIWLESEEAKFLKNFNNEFEKNKNEIQQNNIFSSGGYGSLMDKTNIKNSLNDDIYKKIICKLPIGKIPKKLIYKYLTNLKNIFHNELIFYETPSYLPNNYGNFQRMDIKKVNDYSNSENGLYMSDYKKAHSGKLVIQKNWNIKEKTLEELIEERKSFDDRIKNFKSDITLVNKKIKQI